MNHLTRYTRPKDFADFADFDRTEYYVCFGQHRDSDTLTRSNHRSVLAALGGESETVLVVRDNHWAVGWVEAIYIHESDTTALAIADSLAGKVKDYPVVDEDDWGTLQLDDAYTVWSQLNIANRVDICQRFHCSVFAARRDEIPDDLQGELIAYLSDGV